MRALVAMVVILAAAAAVDPGAALNLLARAQSYRLLSDLAYGDGPRAKLDVYLPEHVSAPRPLVVFFYGGRWSSGEKAQYRFVGAALAARGALAVIPDYRLYPPSSFPAFLEDASRALRWTTDNAERLGADRSRIFLMGHSAGGHIAAMLAFDKRWLAAVGLSPSRDLAGFIGLAGAYDFAIDSDVLRGVFGPPANAAATQPLRYVTREAPPALLLAGEADRTVRPRNTRALAAAIDAAGGEARALYYPGVAHREIVGAFSPLLHFLAPVADDVMAFVVAKRAKAHETKERRAGDRDEDVQ
ncbi:MAG: alpha/beta hydrolase [Methylocystis sp.]